MASNEEVVEEGDLIDLHVGSPILPRAGPSIPEPADFFDNLIDSELPVLEEKLQKTSNVSEIPNNTVDIEDILISLDDEEELPQRNHPIRRSISEEFLSRIQNTPQLDKSWSCDHLEALTILKSLDDLLNAQETREESSNQDIEACLLDLDNYLQAFESFDSSNETLSCTNSTGRNSPTRLHQIEENYVKFISSSGYVTSPNNGESTRSASACELPEEHLNRNHPTRNTVIGKKLFKDNKQKITSYFRRELSH